jgi:hypothetical protein
MAIERTSGTSNVIEVLDRVLDKGIVIDAWVRLSLVGIDLMTVEARIVVASIATYLQYSAAVGEMAGVSAPPPPPSAGAHNRLVGRRLPIRAQPPAFPA